MIYLLIMFLCAAFNSCAADSQAADLQNSFSEIRFHTEALFKIMENCIKQGPESGILVTESLQKFTETMAVTTRKLSTRKSSSNGMMAFARRQSTIHSYLNLPDLNPSGRHSPVSDRVQKVLKYDEKGWDVPSEATVHYFRMAPHAGSPSERESINTALANSNNPSWFARSFVIGGICCRMDEMYGDLIVKPVAQSTAPTLAAINDACKAVQAVYDEAKTRKNVFIVQAAQELFIKLERLQCAVRSFDRALAVAQDNLSKIAEDAHNSLNKEFGEG